MPKPKTVTLTQADVKPLPRLSGSVEIENSNDVDVQSVLTHHRTVVGFRAQSVRPNDPSYGDEITFGCFSLTLDGPVAMTYQQLMSGCIDWQSSVVNTETSDKVGSSIPPSNWKELSNAVLDLATSSNNVAECALRLATFNMEKNEPIHTYALRSGLSSRVLKILSKEQPLTVVRRGSH